MFFHHNDVGAENDLESTAASNAVDRGDDGLVEITRVVQAAEAAHSPVRIRLFALRRGLEIPPGREEFFARPGYDGDAQPGVVAERGENGVEAPARREIDRVGFGPVQCDFENCSVAPAPDAILSGL